MYQLFTNSTRTPEEIITSFKESGYKHMHDIPGNRVFQTDSTSSTLVWVEGRVVIEYYIMHPNGEVPMHWHPFNNQMIFLNGQLTAVKKHPDTEKILQRTFTTNDCHFQGPVLQTGNSHGFTTGPQGATLYNIQIWSENVSNPLSASIEYLGQSIGPIHEQMMKEFEGN
jgi:hypothetical protein